MDEIDKIFAKYDTLPDQKQIAGKGTTPAFTPATGKEGRAIQQKMARERKQLMQAAHDESLVETLQKIAKLRARLLDAAIDEIDKAYNKEWINEDGSPNWDACNMDIIRMGYKDATDIEKISLPQPEPKTGGDLHLHKHDNNIIFQNLLEEIRIEENPEIIDVEPLED